MEYRIQSQVGEMESLFQSFIQKFMVSLNRSSLIIEKLNFLFIYIIVKYLIRSQDGEIESLFHSFIQKFMLV